MGILVGVIMTRVTYVMVGALDRALFLYNTYWVDNPIE